MSRDGWERLAEQANYCAEALARLERLSLGQLRRSFKQSMGCSLQRWLNGRKMVAAGACLCAGMGVKETSARLGFKWTSHFCSAFKAYHGVTAREYIARARAAADSVMASPPSTCFVPGGGGIAQPTTLSFNLPLLLPESGNVLDASAGNGMAK